MNKLVVVGAGGFGREVVTIVAAINAASPTWDLLGVLDDAPSASNTAALAMLGQRVLGAVQLLGSLDAYVVLAIGSPAVRARLDAEHRSAHWAVLIHPQATVGHGNVLGPGTVIAPGARLSTGIHAGRHTHVDQNVTVGHDVVLGDHVRLNPQACVSGSVKVGDRTLVGAAAVILEGRKLGRDVVVGAGAVVTRDVPSATVVMGVPAR